MFFTLIVIQWFNLPSRRLEKVIDRDSNESFAEGPSLKTS